MTLPGSAHAGDVVALGGGDGLGGPVEDGVDVVGQHRLLGQHAQDLGALGSVGEHVEAGDEADERVGERVIAAGLPVEAGEAAVGAGAQLEVAGILGQGAEALAVFDGVGVQAGEPGGACGGGPELGVVGGFGEAELGQLEGLERGADGQVADRAPAGQVDHLVGTAGALGVAGHGGEAVAVGRHQGVEGGLVDPPVLAPEEALLDRLAGEVVAEAEHVGFQLDQQTARDEVSQHGDERGLIEAGHGGEDVEGDPPAEDRRRLHDAAGASVELVDLVVHSLRQVPRQGSGAEVLEGHTARRQQQLLEEEGVAAAAGRERLDDAVGRAAAVDREEEGAHVGLAEAADADVDGVGPALQAGERLGERVAARQLARPVGAHDGARARCGGDPLEQGDALGVGPVEVLEHEHGPLPVDDLGEQVEGEPGPIGQRTVAGVGGAVVGGAQQRDPVIAGEPRPERVEEQAEGMAEAARLGLTGHDDHGGVELRAQLADEAGLADAGLAADEDDARLGLGQRSEQAVELVGPTDHHGTEAPASDLHGLSVPTILFGFAGRRHGHP